MTIHLHGLVLRGEFNHSRRNSVCGWIELDTSLLLGHPDVIAELRFIHIDITGNFSGPLAGKAWRFEDVRTEIPSDPFDLGDDFQDRQIGVLTTASYTSPDTVPSVSDQSVSTSGELPPSELILEWSGQNGSIRFALKSPIVEFEGAYEQLRDPFPALEEESTWENDGEAIDQYLENKADSIEDRFGLQPPMYSNADDWFVSDPIDEVDDAHADEPDVTDAILPYLNADERELPALSAEADDLFDDLDRDDDESGARWTPDSSTPPKLRPWDEVIPGIDPSVKAMYEKWDEVTYGTRDEPLTWLFDGAFKLPRPEMITDESEAEDALRVLLAQLARCGVAFDMCEHMDAKSAYRILVEDMLPEATVHPQLVSTGFVMHFSTFDHCRDCLAEIGEFEGDGDSDVESMES
ncbi:MAG: hypothetical protein U0892_22305 [Pirellulales bacterium]